MTRITLRVIDGSDRGRVFNDLSTPITVGREEGNSVQLNDERVSRFHLKIQEDHERLVLTDLESTNGTKVNGEDIKLRILRFGDQISVGRSVLLFGSRDEISGRLSKIRNLRSSEAASNSDVAGRARVRVGGPDHDVDLPKHTENLQARLFEVEPPDLPNRLSPVQAAQLSELLEYLHIRLRELVRGGQVDPKGERCILEADQWQYLLDLQARVAEYLRQASDPSVLDD